LNEPLLQIQATDSDLDENGIISYAVLPPYENLFLINHQGEIFQLENLNQSSYHFQIMAIDHGKTIRLNSTIDCFITIRTNETTNQSMNIRKLKYNSIILFVILTLLLLIIGIILCFYKFFNQHPRCFQPNKTYHLYVSIPRKSLYIEDQSPCEFTHLNSDQISDKVNQKISFFFYNKN
jgi:hypothetical protein